MTNSTFPGFEYSAEELSAYAFSIDIFVISLIRGPIIRFFPQNIDAFRKWLDSNGVRDITNDAGSLVMNYYRKLK